MHPHLRWLQHLTTDASPPAPHDRLVKQVTDAGTFRFQQHLLRIAKALIDQWIGLEETDDGVWSIATFSFEADTQKVSPMSSDQSATYLSGRSSSTSPGSHDRRQCRNVSTTTPATSMR